MKYSVIIAALVAAVAAQDLASLAAEIPACAKPALDAAATAVGCTATDYACQCGENKEKITIDASPKVIEACGTEAQQVLAATNALCEAAAAAPAQPSSSAAAPATTAADSSSAAMTSSAASSSSGIMASATSAVESLKSEASSKVAGVTSAAGSAAAAATSAVAGSGAMNNAVNMGAMLGAAGVVAAMI